MKVDSKAAAELRRKLGRWYAEHRRDLPWRRTRDPYAIWVSEAMLQQTRVEAVLDHYGRFLERFPTVEALGRASEEDVLAAWSGLGYYRRARALHRAARVIREERGGRFPETHEELLELPGVGPYTAGAVASIAFDQPAPIVDGNVARVFARWFAIEEPVDRPAGQRLLWSLARDLLPSRRGKPGPGDWSQALMELGALVCKPKAPSCETCPVAGHCLARRADLVGSLPRRTPKRDPVPVALEVLLLQTEAGTLLVRRPGEGRMANMWELPTREVRGTDSDPHLWSFDFPRPPRGSIVSQGKTLFVLKHSITHHRITLEVRAGRLTSTEATAAIHGSEVWRFETHERALDQALTGMARKVLSRSARSERPAP